MSVEKQALDDRLRIGVLVPSSNSVLEAVDLFAARARADLRSRVASGS